MLSTSSSGGLFVTLLIQSYIAIICSHVSMLRVHSIVIRVFPSMVKPIGTFWTVLTLISSFVIVQIILFKPTYPEHLCVLLLGIDGGTHIFYGVFTILSLSFTWFTHNRVYDTSFFPPPYTPRGLSQRPTTTALTVESKEVNQYYICIYSWFFLFGCSCRVKPLI